MHLRECVITCLQRDSFRPTVLHEANFFFTIRHSRIVQIKVVVIKISYGYLVVFSVRDRTHNLGLMEQSCKLTPKRLSHHRPIEKGKRNSCKTFQRRLQNDKLSVKRDILTLSQFLQTAATFLLILF